jgi:oligopeptide/dipeptide ABC transporter ATP-binding protein
VAIAQALCCQPPLVIADEPTSKLDAALQVDIVRLLARLRERHRMACLIISHDPAVFAGWTDRLLVMYAGEIVEEGAAEQVFRRPLHPYAQALMRVARSSLAKTRERLAVIEGEPPNALQLPRGCAFQPRCPDRMAGCAERRPALNTVEVSRQVSCFKYE